MSIINFKQRNFSVPYLFRDLIVQEGSFTYVELTGKESFGKIIKYLKSGKFIIVVNSPREKALKLYKDINKRIDEIIPFDITINIRSKDFSRNRKREYEKLKDDILNRILIVAQDNRITSFSEDIQIPYFISFCGEDPDSTENAEEYLIPFKFFLELNESLDSGISIRCSGFKISSGKNVLLPKSQETSELFRDAMLDLNRRSGLKIIDMGCGSGVLTLIADSIFENSEINFTDILPEALASTLYNIDSNRKLLNSTNRKTACSSGDLFEKTDDLFDLIIFNPPWVDAPARNRSEFALNDKDQKLLERFIVQAKSRLAEDGRIALAYSDNSGEKAVDKFNSIIEQNGFITEKEYHAKVQSYQSGRKWMKIFVRTLRSGAKD
ncbi:MAG: class I SAM-dependent methyltransferase [Candidatus Delongbacteria bacterium]|nr:class I SAM-dependent methyltransferase [Candidatus Delongbacteria bacterium]